MRPLGVVSGEPSGSARNAESITRGSLGGGGR